MSPTTKSARRFNARSIIIARVVLALTLLTSISGWARADDPAPDPNAFGAPRRVSIVGYAGDAMEPFVSRDGKYLFFNNSNAPGNDTNLFWATRVDDVTFTFRGPIRGANTTMLDAVASMDRAGDFYFVSNRSYNQTFSTIYHATFADGAVSSPTLVPKVSLATPGIVTFDAEISPDGRTLYFAEGSFAGGNGPHSSQILFARGDATTGFVRDPDATAIMHNVNAANLQYAPDISTSGRELFFTRLDPTGPSIYRAIRHDVTGPFGAPERIASIDGFVEAPSLSGDGKTLYYHRKEGTAFVLYCVSRPEPGP